MTSVISDVKPKGETEMFSNLFSNRLFIGVLAIFIFCVGGSLLYRQHVEKQSARELAEMQERIKTSTEKPSTTAEAPVGDTSQGGHWHGDEWHADPHAPVEVSAAEVSADVLATSDVLAAPVVAQQTNTQIDEATLESAARKLKDPNVYNAWSEWSKKYSELSEEFSQSNWESIDAGPKTEEEQKRFNNDPEWQRRYNEALHKSAKIYARLIAHEKENPLLQ